MTHNKSNSGGKVVLIDEGKKELDLIVEPLDVEFPVLRASETGAACNC